MSDYMVALPPPKNRKFFFNRVVTPDSVADASRLIIDVNEHDAYLTRLYPVNNAVYNPAPIGIFLDTPGGYVYNGLGLIDIMANSHTPIHTIVTGEAMSMGLIIAICGHKRFAHRNSTYMLHQVSSGSIGKIEELRKNLEETERLQSSLNNIIIRNTRIRADELAENRRTQTDWYITAEEAIRLAMVDKIIGE